MKVIGLKIYHFSKWTFLLLLISIALLSIAGRTLLGNVEYFKNSIEQELADYGIKGVTLNNVEGYWQGLQPLLKIKGASLSIPGHSQALTVNELSLRVKLVPSLLSRDLILESFHSNIEKLLLVRDDAGIWWLNDIQLSPDKSGNAYLDIYSLFRRLPSFVNIDIGEIQLRDLYYGQDYLIQNSTLSSSRKKQQLSLQFLSRLPSGLGNKINFFLTGDALSQKLYLDADKLDLKKIFQLVSVKKIPLHKAVISLQSWVEFERFHLKKLVSKADVSELSFNEKEKKQQTLSFSFQQQLKSDLNQWRIDTEINQIKKDQQQFENIKTQLLVEKQNAKSLLWVDKIKLDFVRRMLQDLVTDEKMINLLSATDPLATVDNVVAELDLNNLTNSKFEFNFSDLTLQNYQAIPSINGINGSLVYSQGVSQLSMNAEKVALDFGPLFREPVKLESLKATNYLYYQNSTVYIDTQSFSMVNADASIQGRSWLQIPAEGRPFLALRTNYKNAQVSAVSRYLPIKIMPEEVVNWIDKSVLSGQIPQGDFLFHGRLIKPSQFSENQSGVLHASLDVKNSQIDYFDNWPKITRAEGKVDFLNSGMNVVVSNANFANTSVNNATVKIADFRKADLMVHAKAETDANKLLTMLSDLPILNVFDQVKQKTIAISGPVQAEVKLNIPLSKKIMKKIRVIANADLKGVQLEIPDWMIHLNEMKGSVEINNDKVTSTALSGKFYDDQIRLSIKPDIKRKRTDFNFQGDIHSQQLLTLVPDYLRQPVSGNSAWDISVSLAHQSSEKSALLEIDAKSGLSGSRLNFPSPAKVTLIEKKPISFKAKLYDKGDFPFDLSLSDTVNINGRLNLSSTAAENLQWLNVSLGDFGHIQSQSGVTIAGNTELVDMNHWFSYQNKFFTEVSDQSSPFLEKIKSLELDIGQLVLGGQTVLNSHLKIQNNKKQLLGEISSNQLKGGFQLPYKISVLNPFLANLEYLKLQKSPKKEKFEIDIQDMPNLYITSEKLSFEQMEFSDFILSTRNESNNFVVEQLDFSHAGVQLKSSGQWQYDEQTREHVSVFNIDIKGSDFGAVIKNLGLGESIKGSQVEFNGQIGWGGELYSINWPTLIGEVDLKLKKGYLRNVNPGAGRFVGLLSFNALPKRLFLDFGDVVKEGMQFDLINGKFSILGENLETENTILDSVSAKVKIKGKTNLRHQTYDQTMTIIPKIGDTLPLIGSIASGSAVGWGLLLLQKIFKKPIEKSVEIEYKVTGSWEEPEVNLIKKPNLKKEGASFNDADL